MMRIIFPNLTEKKKKKKNVLAFNFFLSVNEQFQESFLWDKKRGWEDLYWQADKKVGGKQHHFSGAALATSLTVCSLWHFKSFLNVNEDLDEFLWIQIICKKNTGDLRVSAISPF